MRLQLGERGSRITAKAPPLRALLAVGLKVLAQRLPGTDRFGDAGCARDRVEAGGRASEASHRATQPQCGGSALASGGAPLMRAMGAKPLLSLMMGTRQLGDALAVQEPWPVTLGDCTEVLEGGCAGAGGRLVAGHRSQQPSQAVLDGSPLTLFFVAKDRGRLLHPARPHPHVRPPGGRGCQAPLK